jgi:hypothetical protein
MAMLPHPKVRKHRVKTRKSEEASGQNRQDLRERPGKTCRK